MRVLHALLSLFKARHSPKHYAQNSKELSKKNHSRNEDGKWEMSTEINTPENKQTGESRNDKEWCSPTEAGTKIWCL